MLTKIRFSTLFFLILSYISLSSYAYAFGIEKKVTPISPENTYMLAIGVCPPWKGEAMGKTCKNDVNRMTDVFKNKYGIPEKNIQTVLDKDATYDGVKKGFAWLKSKEKNAAKTRAIIYINLHGTVEGSNSILSKEKEHELMVLWTEDRPFSVDVALESKQWMKATEMREMLDSFDSEKIVIMDACHSGAAVADLDAHQSLIPNINEREAIIVSAKPSQVAHVTSDISMALFTKFLGDAIMSGAPNLDKAFDVSAKEIAENTEETCKIVPEYEELPKKVCNQMPTKHDPHGLLKEVRFDSN